MHGASTVHRPKQTRLAHELVKHSLLLNELARAVEFLHFTVIKHYDAIAIEDGVDAETMLATHVTRARSKTHR